MKSRILLLIFLVGIITYLIIYPIELIRFGILSGWGWTFSTLTHWIVITGLSIVIAVQLPVKKNWKTTMLRICIPFLFGGIYFARNPIYQGDYAKKGTEMNLADNSLVKEITAINPDFDGIVCIAAVWCPFCKEATRQRLKIMKNRKPDLDVAVYLADKDSTAIDYFIQETGADNLQYFQVQDSSGMVALSHGAYPTFVYIKNKKVIHKWRNDQMGYPTLDWIENKLN
jgi:hypothetical protein